MLLLKQLREARGLNMRETAKLLEMPYTTYVNYEKGLREPTSEMLIALADFFEVTIDYLLGRSEEPFQIMTPPLTVAPAVPSLAFSDDEISMIQKFRCLDDRGQSAVLNVLEHEYNSLPGEKADPAPKEA